VSLDEFNELIAKQKGISVDELSLLDQPKTAKQQMPLNPKQPNPKSKRLGYSSHRNL
jgi:hypothetical protein